MKRWFYAVGIGLGLVLVSLAPPSDGLPWGDERAERSIWTFSSPTLGNALREEQQTLRRIEWLDTIDARVAASADGIVSGLIIYTPQAVVDEDPERVVRDQLSRIGVAMPQARVGAFWIEEGAGPGQGLDTDGTMLVRDGADPYCFAVRTRRPGEMWKTLVGDFWTNSSPVLACGFYAKYGSPGAGTGEWLRLGGFEYAWSPAGDYRTPTDVVTSGRSPSRSLLNRFSLDEAACAGGRFAACRMRFLNPRNTIWAQASRDGLAYTVRMGATGLGPFSGNLLHDLEQDFGTQRFARFWSSDEPVEQAFQSAFGVEVGEWVHGWVVDTYGSQVLGPGAGFAAGATALLGIALFGALATAVARRRRYA